MALLDFLRAERRARREALMRGLGHSYEHGMTPDTQEFLSTQAGIASGRDPLPESRRDGRLYRARHKEASEPSPAETRAALTPAEVEGRRARAQEAAGETRRAVGQPFMRVDIGGDAGLRHYSADPATAHQRLGVSEAELASIRSRVAEDLDLDAPGEGGFATSDLSSMGAAQQLAFAEPRARAEMAMLRMAGQPTSSSVVAKGMDLEAQVFARQAVQAIIDARDDRVASIREEMAAAKNDEERAELETELFDVYGKAYDDAQVYGVRLSRNPFEA